MTYEIKSRGGKKTVTVIGQAKFDAFGVIMPRATSKNYTGPIYWPWARVASVVVA